MRRKDRQISDLVRLEAIISRTWIFYLAMTDEAGPYVVPLNFGYDSGVFFVHGADEGRKIRALERDNRVSFALHAPAVLKSADQPCAFGVRFESVVGFGHALRLSDLNEKAFGLRVICAQVGVDLAGFPALSPEQVKKSTVLRIDVQHMTGKSSI